MNLQCYRTFRQLTIYTQTPHDLSVGRTGNPSRKSRRKEWRFNPGQTPPAKAGPQKHNRSHGKGHQYHRLGDPRHEMGTPKAIEGFPKRIEDKRLI